MKYKEPATLRLFFGVIFALLIFAFVMSFAHERDLLPDFMSGNGNPQTLVIIVAGNILSQLHWERVVPDQPAHWARLVLLVLVHLVPFYVATAFVVLLIFKLT